tara:strand:+ start:6277 stop:6642 length:366 start_codon:yes stop_codon:yes gene_type:complete
LIYIFQLVQNPIYWNAIVLIGANLIKNCLKMNVLNFDRQHLVNRLVMIDMNSTTIQSEVDFNLTLEKLTVWLKKEVVNPTSYAQIREDITALELYMGIPLPAKKYIEWNCNISSNRVLMNS